MVEFNSKKLFSNEIFWVVEIIPVPLAKPGSRSNLVKVNAQCALNPGKLEDTLVWHLLFFPAILGTDTPRRTPGIGYGS